MQITIATGVSIVCRAGSVLCAWPIEHVAETMRPMPVEHLASSPSFVLGLSVIRGAPIPVVDAAALLGEPDAPTERFLIVKSGPRRIAVAVRAVIGARALAPGTLLSLPPLLGSVAGDTISAMGTLEGNLLLVLESVRLVPDSVWAVLENRSPAS